MGGFEVLKQIIAENRAEPSYDAKELANNQCPYCWWPLNKNSKGERACPMCERTF